MKYFFSKKYFFEIIYSEDLKKSISVRKLALSLLLTNVIDMCNVNSKIFSNITKNVQ